jgi:hypothetical protein
MPAKRKDPDQLFATRWVHIFEEDSGKGTVYRPEADAKLSRRPRERIELRPDGSARLFMPGPDDRLVEQPAAWRDERGGVVIRARDGGAELRILDQSPARLVVQVRRAKPAR